MIKRAGRSLDDLGYHEQPDLRCCENCRNARPADMTWSRWSCVLADRTRVSNTGICPMYEQRPPPPSAPADTSGMDADTTTGEQQVTP